MSIHTKHPDEATVYLGLASAGLVPVLLSVASTVPAFAVGLTLSGGPHPWPVLVVAGLLLGGCATLVFRIARTSVTVSHAHLEVRFTGPIGSPVVIPLKDVYRVESMLGSSRILLQTVDGRVTWIGPFQLGNCGAGRRALDDLTQLIRLRVERLKDGGPA